MKTVLFLVEDRLYRCDHRVRREDASLRANGLGVVDGCLELPGFRGSFGRPTLGEMLDEDVWNPLEMGTEMSPPQESFVEVCRSLFSGWAVLVTREAVCTFA